MNHPPAPILGCHQLAALTVHEAGCIEERNRYAGDEKEQEQRPVLALANERGLERRHHQDKPQNEADEQQNLPESSQVNIFIPLAAEPEPQIAKALLDAQPFSRERTANHENQRAKEYINTEPLELGLVAADRWSDIKSCCQPRSRNPEDGQLQMPGASDGVGQSSDPSGKP